MASPATATTSATKFSKSTTAVPPLADVTGAKKHRGPQKGVSRGPRTVPMLGTSFMSTENRDMVGAVTKTARAIAARNSGYVNVDMIYRELKDHDAFQKVLTSGGEAVTPTPAYKVLTPQKVRELHQLGVDAWIASHPDGDAYGEDESKEGPKNGPFARLAQVRGGRVELEADEADEL